MSAPVAHPFAPAPSSIVTARWLASVQVVIASAGAMLSLVWVAAALAATGEWADLGAFIAVAVTGLFVAAALLIGVPLALLRCGRPVARISLIVGELILAVPMLFLAPYLAGAAGGAPLVNVLVLGNSVCIVGVIVCLSRREARVWSSWTPVASHR